LELEPDVAGEGGLGAGAEDEDSDWGGFEAEAFEVDVFACSGWVEGVAEGWFVSVGSEESLLNWTGVD
jgi:hypothetical protein